MTESTNSSQTKLNTYTFSGIRFIPSYRDFDQDDVDVEASNEKEAWDNLYKVAKNWKMVGITHVNGESVNNLPAEDNSNQVSKRKYFKGAKTLKSLAIEFVLAKGSATSTEIRKFLYETSNPGQIYDPIEHRGYYSSYFSDSGVFCANMFGTGIVKSQLLNPTKTDDRFLVKQASGAYTVSRHIPSLFHI